MFKVKRVAIKIFISYLAIVFLTFMSIHMIFKYLKMGPVMKKIDHYNMVSRYAIKELIKSKFTFESSDGIKNNINLRNNLKDALDVHLILAVVTKSDNSILLHPFEGYLPNRYKDMISEYDNRDHHEKRFPYPVKLKLKIGDNEQIFVYLFFEDPVDKYSELLFYSSVSLLMLLAACSIYLIAMRITKPLDKFKEVIAKITSGDFSRRLEIKSLDEFEEVANVFNRMTSRIEETVINQKQLSAHVSHELRSPLARIRVAKQIIDDLSKNENCKTYLDSIDREIEGMDRLIDVILHYFKIENTELKLERELDLITLARMEFDKNKLTFAHKKINYQKEINVKNFSIMAMPHVNSIFSNLFTNACKYTPKEGVFKMKVEMKEGHIIFTFYNSLINPQLIEHPEKLFEPFYRGNHESGEKGTGMGLSITRKLCERYGGWIECAVTDKGICFKVVFPGYIEQKQVD